MPERMSSPEKIGKMSVVEFYPDQSQVRVLDVVLDVLPLPKEINARRFIPPWKNIQSTACWDTPTATLIRDMAIRLAGGISSRNEGPTGVSKSFAAEVICALTNRSYLRHNYSRESEIGDTIGKFVPKDKSTAIRLEELLADPDLKGQPREMVLQAQRETRPLAPYEIKRIAKSLGFNGLDDDNAWKWQNGTLTGSMAYGTVFGADEPNLALGNILERENSAIEKNPSMRIVEHGGEIIRALTAEEKSIVEHGGVVPGVIGLDQKYWYVAAQNPYGIGGGRTEESEARRNRLQDRIVEALTPKEYEEFLKFLVHGDQPDIVWQGRKYTGDKNIQTAYRKLEEIPNIDIVVERLAKFQSDLEKLTQGAKIGSMKDINGGSYVFTRRNLIRFMDTIVGAKKSLLDVDETAKQKKPVYNTNWYDLVMEGIYQEYVAGVYKKDQEVVMDLLSANGLMDNLGESKNNPKPPKWVEAAGKKGVQVTRGDKGWQIK